MLMDDVEFSREQRIRTRKFIAAVCLCLLGGVLAGVSAAFAEGRLGATGGEAGLLTGIGLALCLGGAIVASRMRPWDRRWQAEPRTRKRDRLQAERARQLWTLTPVSLLFLFQATRAIDDITAGRGDLTDYFSAFLPVLYAWIVALITMGMDQWSFSNRRLLEDELTMVLRARALIAAFFVLMAGATVALGLGLWRLEIGIIALPFALAAAGATAGVRFAWLDREAGKDG